jgi:tripartite-type tricarboxylate transporter receptor subunit TctC
MLKQTPKKSHHGLTRRGLIKSAALGGASALFAPAIAGRAFAQSDFPSRAMQVLIPTGEGGGVDRTARAFNAGWRELLGVGFEYGYFPGAAGQVGYETFMGRRDADCYNLLFGAIGPEMIMYATQNPSYTFPDDYVYFAGLNADDTVLWVPENSPFQTLEDLIEEGQRRRVNFSGSRLPHPASIAVFLLAEATGADFNVIPYGGGNPARSAALTGEVDACCTFMSASLSVADQVRFLTVFQDENRIPALTNDAQPVNDILGTNFPALDGLRAYAIQRAAIEQYPERFELLKATMLETYESGRYDEATVAAGLAPDFNVFIDEDACTRSAMEFIALANRFENLLREG